MKNSKPVVSKDKAIAIGFTVAVHIVAIGSLLYLGLSKPPEPPKKIKTILIKPEDLPPPEPIAVDTTDETEPVMVDIAEPSPAIEQPSGPSPAELQALAASKLAAEKHAAEQKAQAQAAEQARLQAVAAEKARLKAIEDARNAKTAEAKAKAQEQARQQQLAAERARQQAAAAEQKRKDAIAAEQKRKQAEADAAKRKQAEADAAKRKQAEANRKRLNSELDDELADTKKASAQAKTAQAKTTASNATRDFRNKVDRTWQPPVGKTGEKATVSVTLTPSGQVASVYVSASDPAVKASAEKAVRAAAPYPMPSDPEARRLAQSFKSTLTVK